MVLDPKVELFETDDGQICIIYQIPFGDAGIETFGTWPEAWDFIANTLNMDPDDFDITDFEEA